MYLQATFNPVPDDNPDRDAIKKLALLRFQGFWWQYQNNSLFFDKKNFFVFRTWLFNESPAYDVIFFDDM